MAENEATLQTVTAQSWGTHNLALLSPLWIALTIVGYIVTQHFLDPKSHDYVHWIGFGVAFVLPVVLLYALSVRAWVDLKTELGGLFDVVNRSSGKRFYGTDLVGGAFLAAAGASIGYFALALLQNFWPGEPAAKVVIPEPNLIACGALVAWFVIGHRLYINHVLPKQPVTELSHVNAEGEPMHYYVTEAPAR